MAYVGRDACCDLKNLSVEWLKQAIDGALSPGQAQEGESISSRLIALEGENARAARQLLF